MNQDESINRILTIAEEMGTLAREAQALATKVKSSKRPPSLQNKKKEKYIKN
jgi:hypothetical protein